MDPEKRKDFINKEIGNHFIEAVSLGKEVFAMFLQGSQNYGLDIYNEDYKSDIDTKAIILPSFKDFLITDKSLCNYTYERENKEHIDLKDIRIMFDTFKKQNMNFIEILFTDFYVFNMDWKEEFKELRSLGEDISKCHPSQALKTMAGMSMEKYKALCHPYPSIKHKIDKWGYDGKQLHHIIRINDFMSKFIQGASYKECMVPSKENLQLLIDAKLNKYPLEEAITLAKKYDDENKKIKDQYIKKYGDKILNPKPYKDLDNLKFRILKKHFTNQLNNEVIQNGCK